MITKWIDSVVEDFDIWDVKISCEEVIISSIHLIYSSMVK
mgnify:CR=1 FL=1|jgi:hypothetical protein